jgi:hypothetical protein
MTKEKEYAKVIWMPLDIQGLRPNWSIEECEEWLAKNQGYIRDGLIEAGHRVIENLLPEPVCYETKDLKKMSGGPKNVELRGSALLEWLMMRFDYSRDEAIAQMKSQKMDMGGIDDVGTGESVELPCPDKQGGSQDGEGTV